MFTIWSELISAEVKYEEETLKVRLSSRFVSSIPNKSADGELSAFRWKISPDTNPSNQAGTCIDRRGIINVGIRLDFALRDRGLAHETDGSRCKRPLIAGKERRRVSSSATAPSIEKTIAARSLAGVFARPWSETLTPIPP